MGRYFIFRGQTEMLTIVWDQLKFGEYGPDSGKLSGVPYAQFINLSDKSYQINLSK